MVLKTFLHGQMKEKIASEVRPKKWSHMKFKSKPSYLGEKISILPWQMAEQLAVEVDVKNVTEHVRTDTRTSSFIWLGCSSIT